jgi:hypothetical protein
MPNPQEIVANMRASTSRMRATRPIAAGMIARAGLLMAAMALLAACASQSSVTTNWADGAPRDRVYSRVLVVAVTSDANARCMFEEFMASQLASAATQVFQSCDASATVTPPTRASIAAAARATNADAVVASMLVREKEGEQTGGTRDTRGGEYFQASGEAMVSGPLGFNEAEVEWGREEYVPATTVVEGTLDVTTHFYSTQGPQLVCTLDTVVHDVQSTEGGMAALTEAVADRLRRDKLVR